MPAGPPTAVVPCGSCRACCKGEEIVLQPGLDDRAAYPEAIPTTNVFTGEEAWKLPQKDNGECVHLTEAGCAIHDRAPAICRTFSCIGMYLMHDRAERRRRERLIPGAKDLYARGRELAIQEGLMK